MTRIKYFKVLHMGSKFHSLFKCVPLDYYRNQKSLGFLRKLWLFEGEGEFPEDSYVIYVTVPESWEDNLITYYHKLTGSISNDRALLDSPTVVSYEEITKEEFKANCKILKIVNKLMK